MKILLATHNAGKFKEMSEVLGTFPAQWVSLQELNVHEDCPEEEQSFAENALEKARFYYELTGIPTVADDSGIFVDALAGELGVKTRRWGAGARANDEEWMDYFMQRMAQEKNRRARFVCAAAYTNGVDSVVFEADTLGRITERVEVPFLKGIPLSSVFLPDGCSQVYSALSVEEKNKLSHRGKAFRQLLAYLEETL